MQNRAQLDRGANNVLAAQGGDIAMSQLRFNSNATVGAATLSANSVLNGVLNRTGSTAGFTDTFPAASLLLAAAPNLSVGDSWSFIYRNTVAFAMTAAAGVGIELGSDVNIAASAVREYLFTVLGVGTPVQVVASTTNGSAVLTNLSQTDVAQAQVGMGISGAGIPASSYIIGTDQNAGTITINANATATAAFQALPVNPRISVQGVRSSPL